LSSVKNHDCTAYSPIFEVFKGDRIVVYIVEHWHQMAEPRSKLEIIERRFFALNALPNDIDQGARRRLAEVLEGRTISPEW
jgi:hypothetical protein